MNFQMRRVRAHYSWLLLPVALLLSACGVQPEAIDYGADACAFCSMTIVARTHAAQLVTEKGKQFKFDAVECMVNKLPEWEPGSIAHLLVADYANPGTMTDALTATYLISESIKSPMGAHLSAFSSREEAGELRREHGGALYAWEDLPGHLQSAY